LRHAWEWIRERIYEAVVSQGYGSLSRAHVALFRHESLEGQRPIRLAEQMNVTRQSINDLLRDMEQMGLMTLGADRDDRRARVIRLTARGRRLDAAVRAQAIAAERELAAVLGARRFKALRDALVKLESTARRVADPSERPLRRTRR
jgi:DNA-binding MarR family transcriptional regulator